MVAVALLLFALGSVGDCACAVAVLVIVPRLVGFTTIVTVTVFRFGMLPKLQLTSRLVELKLQLPCVVATVLKLVAFGRVSNSVTPFAVE